MGKTRLHACIVPLIIHHPPTAASEHELPKFLNMQQATDGDEVVSSTAYGRVYTEEQFCKLMLGQTHPSQ